MSGVLMWLVLGFAYVLGAVVSGAMLCQIGEANPRSYGDSWTGDDMLDLISLVVWPATFFIAAVIVVGSFAGKLIVRRFK